MSRISRVSPEGLNSLKMLDGKVVLNARQEMFALLIAQGMSQLRAATEAGYKKPGVVSTRLMRDPDIQNRVAELRPVVSQELVRQTVAAIVPSREFVLRELMEVAAQAKEAKDRAALLRSLELMGKEVGMFVARTMAIESPLQGLSADRLTLLLRLVEDAQGDVASRVVAAPGAIGLKPMIEAEVVLADEVEKLFPASAPNESEAGPGATDAY